MHASHNATNRHERLESDFQHALTVFRKGDPQLASALLGGVLDAGSTNPVHRSYRGLLLVITGESLSEGIEHCKEALHLGFLETEVYLNIARVYNLTGRKPEALDMLRRGIRSIPGDPQLLAELSRLNPRRQPPLSVVPRNHWLNCFLEKFRPKPAPHDESVLPSRSYKENARTAAADVRRHLSDPVTSATG